MNRSLSRFKPASRPRLPDRTAQAMFFCPEESMFYSQCLDCMVLDRCEDSTAIIEFGSGEGSPVINSLLKHRFNGFITGYELNAQACEVAQARIKHHQLSRRYVVHNSSFFNQALPSSETCLIANPPYLPAIDNDLYLPALHGGVDGASITKEILAIGCTSAMLMISAYSDPIGTIEYAIAQGYQVDRFVAAPMSFGYYSSEPKVKQRIAELKQQDKAFYSQNAYILAGVFFTKRHKLHNDLSMELIKVLTSL
jgi:methylase of polypeptide subunit release factors